MRILVVGASGTIGSAVVSALRPRHDVVEVGHRQGAFTVDIEDPRSIARLLETVGQVDAIVSAAGKARFGPMAGLSDEDYTFSVGHKLMGQIRLLRLGLPFVRDHGAITLTSGYLGRFPTQGSSAVSLVNAALEGFVRAAALDMPRGIRVNVVSPPWVFETLEALGRDPSPGLKAAQVAKAYVASLEGGQNGQLIEP